MGLPFFIALALYLLAPFEAQARRARKASWPETLERVSHAVLAIEVSVTRSLDTDSASSSLGTGFIVDKERGLVLTNRHMVHVGPVRARGITHNNEEVELHAIYRDPIHDFGFFRFDPQQVHYMEIEELPLAPGNATVGTEIRVVGNDAGEKLSILDGTLARLDRPAPNYGRASYNDFNTFYYQAATSTSGGSSGSPVVDITGSVVALNAGGSHSAASSFYLPLQRAARVLDCIRNGQPVPRGTMQAIYRHEPFEELRRLGLTPASEALMRSSREDITGMLVVREVIPGGPADENLQPGDIIVTIDDRLAVDFDVMEDRLDARVGQSVQLSIERGGRHLDIELQVDDLHQLSPSRFVEFSQAILQETSLQVARNHHVPARGVMLVEAGYAFRRARIPRESLLLSIDDQPIRTLEDLAAVLGSLSDGQRVRTRYVDLDHPRQEQLATLTIDHRWSPMRSCIRDDSSGIWDCRQLLPEPTTTAEQAPAAEKPSDSFEQVRDPVASILAPSLCHVRFTIPYRSEGVEGWTYIGAGLVVDAEQGLVYTDRGTVPVALGDVVLTFAGSTRIPAEVVYLHPRHNLAVLRYDPTALGSIPVRTAQLLPGASMDAGDTVHQVGLTSAMRVVSQQTTISRVDAVSSGTSSPPSFRESNTEVYKLADSASSIGGVLADEQGRVVALWTFNVDGDSSGHFLGLPVDLLWDVVQPLRERQKPRLADLGLDVAPISLADARDRGAPSAWIDRLAAADPERRQALTVVRSHPEAPSFESLQGGDVILSLRGQPLTRPRQLESLLRDLEGPVQVLRLRDGTLEEIEVEPLILDGDGISRVVSFAGALFHEPHWAVGMDYGVQASGLYVSWYWYGGPAAAFGLRASTLVRAVNDEPVNDLNSFLDIVRGMEDGAAVRLQVSNLNQQDDVTTLLLDTRYWPTSLIERVEGEGWRTEVLD